MCKDHNVSKTVMVKDEFCTKKFTDREKQLRTPFSAYLDFEALNVPIKENEKVVIKGNTTNHIPCGGKFIIHSHPHEKVIKTYINRSENCVKLVLDNIIAEGMDLWE